jgi:uncharacterized protein YqgC (DUF456 family)
MSPLLLALFALTIAVGLIGIVLPILPGALLIAVAVVAWAAIEGGPTAFIACAVALLALAIAQALKYAVPGRRLHAEGIPTRTLALAAVLAIVGFFAIPVVGLVIGFVGGIYLAELERLRDEPAARASTAVALRAVGLSIGIELAGGLVAAIAWATGVLIVAL